MKAKPGKGRRFRKLRKLHRDPIGYCLDSRLALLRWLGQLLFQRQTRLFEKRGQENAHRKITVIMTAYNTGHLVEAAVRSVLGQTHRNLELMVIDDASTDDTLAILQAMAQVDPRMRVFSSPTNHGTYWSKNWCLSQSTSEFVAFHDSDDTSAPLRLQAQLGAILSKRALAVTCRWQRIDADGNKLIIDGKEDRTAAISLMVRRAEILEKIGYFDSVRISADTEYLRRMSHGLGQQSMFPMRQVLYTGLLRDGSLTREQGGGFIWEVTGRSYNRELSGDRQHYHESFSAWQDAQIAAGLPIWIGFPLESRKFQAPEAICLGCLDRNTGQVQELTSVAAKG